MGFRAPLIGEWYTDLSSRQLFEIVAYDEKGSTVEVQYVDGEVGGFDMESWNSLALEIAAPPEDWTASYEVTQEDSGFDDFSSEYIDDPLSTLEPDSMLGYDEYY